VGFEDVVDVEVFLGDESEESIGGCGADGGCAGFEVKHWIDDDACVA
jgi:hypothetical protein